MINRVNFPLCILSFVFVSLFVLFHEKGKSRSLLIKSVKGKLSNILHKNIAPSCTVPASWVVQHLSHSANPVNCRKIWLELALWGLTELWVQWQERGPWNAKKLTLMTVSEGSAENNNLHWLLCLGHCNNFHSFKGICWALAEHSTTGKQEEAFVQRKKNTKFVRFIHKMVTLW